MFHLLTLASLKSLEGPYAHQWSPNFGPAPPAPRYAQRYVAPPGPPPVEHDIPTANVRTHSPKRIVIYFLSAYSCSVRIVPDRVACRVYQSAASRLILPCQTLRTHSPGMSPTMTLLERQPWMILNVLLLAVCVTHTRRLAPSA
jgi:hypothetical protein